MYEQASTMKSRDEKSVLNPEIIQVMVVLRDLLW